MASRELKKKRQTDLRNFFLDSKNEKILRSDIEKFYNDNYDSICSYSTISRDLSDINVICDKKNNSYFLQEVKSLNTLKSSISKILNNYMIFKPVQISNTINIVDNDTNSNLEYYVITVKPINSKRQEYLSERLYSEIIKLLKFPNYREKYNYMEIKYFINSFLFIFDDENDMKDFYLELNELKSLNESK